MHDRTLFPTLATRGHAILREPLDRLPDIADYQPTMREPDALERPRGSRRRKLWEIASHCHCAVIGVCSPIATLRRLAERIDGTATARDDYEIHVAAVGEARRRSPLIEALQKDLEQRHAVAVRRFNAAKTPAAVLALWEEQSARGDVAGALWAALTHPRCDPDTEEAVYRRVHMLQHQAGAGLQQDAARAAALVAEKAALADELERTRERHRQREAERIAELEALTAEVRRLRLDVVAKDARLAEQREEIERMARDTQDLDSRRALADRVAALTERNRELLDRLSDQSGSSGSATTAAGDDPPVTASAAPGQADWQRDGAGAPLTVNGMPVGTTGPVAPDTRSILCVGGLHRAVAIYRNIVEKRGGRFIHHDGGREDSVHRLEANLAAADLVVCQAGCISHSAYWQVKEHCKRTGKRCIYLEKPSASALSRGLSESRAMPIAAA